jgi:biotin carboxyl carrier protein
MSDENKSAKKSSPVEPAMESLEIGGALYTTRLTSKFRNRQIWQKPDENRIEAVIPGTIQRIMAKEGDEVVAGTPLLILEAMKMRNEIHAPVDGVVRKIYVTEGQMVPKFHLLIEMN